MEKAIIIALSIALVGLFFSRIHFHFSFRVDMTRSSRLHSASRHGREEASVSVRRPQMAMGTAGSRKAGTSGEAPAIRSISDKGVTKALEAAKHAAECDVSSALVNLGCERQKARELAKQAMEQGEDFDSRIKWAISRAA
jgi:hypothetical protein